MRHLLWLALAVACYKPQPNPLTQPKKDTTPDQKPAAFTPPALDTLPDLGVTKVEPLGKPIQPLKKYCPGPKKNGDEPIACQCLSIDDSSGTSSWQDSTTGCAAPTIEVSAPFTNLQLLARQESSPPKEDEEPDISASLSFIFQTPKALLEYPVGSTTMIPALGYSTDFVLEDMKFVDVIAGGDKEFIAVLTTESIQYDDKGKSSTYEGELIVCGQGAAKKTGCVTFPLGLGKKESYELSYKFEGGSLYLVETSAKTSPEIKKLSGKYTLIFP